MHSTDRRFVDRREEIIAEKKEMEAKAEAATPFHNVIHSGSHMHTQID